MAGNVIVPPAVTVPVPIPKVPLLEKELPFANVILKEDPANVVPEPIVSAPFMVISAPMVRVPVPDVVKLLKVMAVDGNVNVPATVTVPVPALKVPLPVKLLPLGNVRLLDEQASMVPEPKLRILFMVVFAPRVKVVLPEVDRLL